MSRYKFDPKTGFLASNYKAKTPGQKLYEVSQKQHLPHRLASWDFLSDATQKHWEKHAVGHPIFCEKTPNRLKNGVNTGYPEVWVNR